MRRRIRAVLVSLSTGLAAMTITGLTVAGVPAATAQTTRAPQPPQPAQPVAQQDLRQAVDSLLQSRLGTRAKSAYGQTAKTRLQTLVEPQRWSADRTWTFGSSAFLIPKGVDAGPVTALFVARQTGGKWQAGLQGTPEVAALSKSAPSSVVWDNERGPFARTVEAAKTGQAPTGLSLPWKQGTGWGHWGVHGNSGQSRPYNSIDFFGGDGNVLASRSGTMYRNCTSGGRWPYITVMHDNGYTTGYYHLRDTTNKASGSPVQLGEYLGHIAEQLPCGGSANGDHTHWTLWSGSGGNTPVAVQGKEIGGWTWYEGASAYQGYAQRGSTKIYRNACCNLINYGGGGDPGKVFENATNVTVPDLGTGESAITVSGVPGNAPKALSVRQDISHTWRGDLQIDLVGPSGKTYRLRDPNADDDANDIHETGTVDASSETANGVWKLRVRDVSKNDSGYIDAWSLTF